MVRRYWVNAKSDVTMQAVLVASTQDNREAKDTGENSVWENLDNCSASPTVILEINNTSSYQMRGRTTL